MDFTFLAMNYELRKMNPFIEIVEFLCQQVVTNLKESRADESVG